MLVLEDEGTPRLPRLAGALQARLEQLGVYRREDRPWLPHLTVARWRERPRLAAGTAAAANVCSVRRCCLPITAAPDGARYEVLESVALGG